MMNEQDMKDFLTENNEEFKRQAKERVVASLVKDYSYDFSNQISKVINEFFDAEISPAVREHLKSDKGEIISGVIKGLEGVQDEIAKSLLAKVKENLDGYSSRTIIKALFE